MTTPTPEIDEDTVYEVPEEERLTEATEEPNPDAAEFAPEEEFPSDEYVEEN